MKTKYNVGDEVWVMHNNQPYKGIIWGMEGIENPIYTIKIYTGFSIGHIKLLERIKIFSKKKEKTNRCYLTKRELLNSFLIEEDKL